MQQPKATRVRNVANWLAIDFDNGQTRYLKTHYARDFVDAFSPSRGKGKRKMLLTSGADMWLGTEVVIQADGTVVLNANDTYSPQELWEDSVTSVM